jgi:hypothetical protein
LYDLLNDMENITSIGFFYLLSSHQFKKVQDKYQFPTHFLSTDVHATATAFAVGYDFWSSIHVDDYYYYTSLSCVAEKVNDRSILCYYCSHTYGMAIPIYLPHGCTDPAKKGVRVRKDNRGRPLS